MIVIVHLQKNISNMMCRYFMIYLHIKVHVSSYISLVSKIKSKAEDSFCKAAIVILHSTKSYLFHSLRISVASIATVSEIHATYMLLLNVVGNASDFNICKKLVRSLYNRTLHKFSKRYVY